MEYCKSVSKEGLEETIDRLEQAGFKKRMISTHPGSLAMSIDEDRILHVCWKYNPKNPPRSAYDIFAEIESNPRRHLRAHIEQNGFKRRGACTLLRRILYESEI
jgi:hypothetical protein